MSEKAYKSSDNPDAVIVRNGRTGVPVRIWIREIPEILRPETWYENPYWLYSGALTRPEVLEILGETSKPLPEPLVLKAAKYIVDFTKNMAAAAWIFCPDPEGYLEFMRPHLARLETLRSKASTRKDILDMVDACLDAAVDPF